MRRFEISLLCGLVLSILLTSFTGFAGECGEVRAHMVRLHVLANSDLAVDQELKLKVRDAILAGTAEVFAGMEDEMQARETAEKNLETIEEIARAELRRNGCGLPVRAKMGNVFFETRTYDGITVPAGRYNAVQVLIGEAKGQNWWCVLFPPMCVPAATEQGGKAADLTQQIERLGEQPAYKPKFAVVEFVEGIREHFAANTNPQ